LLRSVTKYGTAVSGISTIAEVDILGSTSLSLPDAASLNINSGTNGVLANIKLGEGKLSVIAKALVSYNSPKIDITANTSITFNGPLFESKNSLIKLGSGASHPAVLGDLLLQYLISHTHPTGVGPSGPPIVPPPTNILSQVVTLK
jgi:hypothetical protein